MGEDIPWDDLIKAANKAETKTKIQGSIHLDQHCLKEKWLLKMSLNSWDDQAKKTKTIFLQTKASPPTSAQSKATRRVNFVRVNSSGTDFLTPEAKNAFIYLHKAIIKAPILRHFNPKHHI